MLKLYQIESCPYCARVRTRMSELGITYVNVNVPSFRSERKELMEVSGQTGIPTLATEDGQIIADDDDAIIAYLNEHHGK